MKLVRGGWVKINFQENSGQRGTTDIAQKIKLPATKVRGLSIVGVNYEQQSVACGCGVIRGWGSCARSP